MLGKLGKTIGNPRAALAMLLERVLVSQHLRCALNEGETFSVEKRLRTILAIKFFEIGLEVKQFELTGSSNHVQKDDSFGAARMMLLCLGLRIAFGCKGTFVLSGQPKRPQSRR